MDEGEERRLRDAWRERGIKSKKACECPAVHPPTLPTALTASPVSPSDSAPALPVPQVTPSSLKSSTLGADSSVSFHLADSADPHPFPAPPLLFLLLPLARAHFTAP